MAHPFVIAVWDVLGKSWPTNAASLTAGDVRARLALRPTAADLVASVKSAEVRPNAKISIAAVIRKPPVLIKGRDFSATIEPAEIALTTGHTLVTLPLPMLKVPRGVWRGIRFVHLSSVDAREWPLYSTAAAAMAAALPPCSVCGGPSLDVDRCLCAAHLLVDASLPAS